MNTRKKVPLRYSNNAAPCPKFGWTRSRTELHAPDPPDAYDSHHAAALASAAPPAPAPAPAPDPDPDPPATTGGASRAARPAEVTRPKKKKEKKKEKSKIRKKSSSSTINNNTWKRSVSFEFCSVRANANTSDMSSYGDRHEDITSKTPLEIEDGWNSFYRQLVEHKRRHGNLRVTMPITSSSASTTTTSAHDSHKKKKQALLAQWCTLQCMEKDALTPGRRQKLEKIGFPFSNPTPDKFRFEVMFAKLQVFHRKWGDCLVPVRWKPDPKFGRWVSRQRETQSVMPPDRKARLDALNFTWRVCVGDKKMVKDSGRNQPIPGFDAFTVWAPPTATPSNNFVALRSRASNGAKYSSNKAEAKFRKTIPSSATNPSSASGSGSGSSSSASYSSSQEEEDDEEASHHEEEEGEEGDYYQKDTCHAPPTTPTAVSSSSTILIVSPSPTGGPKPPQSSSLEGNEEVYPTTSLSSGTALLPTTATTTTTAAGTANNYDNGGGIRKRRDSNSKAAAVTASANPGRWSEDEKERLVQALQTQNDFDSVVHAVGTRGSSAVRSYGSREYPELYEQLMVRNQKAFLSVHMIPTSEIITTTPKKKKNKVYHPQEEESEDYHHHHRNNDNNSNSNSNIIPQKRHKRSKSSSSRHQSSSLSSPLAVIKISPSSSSSSSSSSTTSNTNTHHASNTKRVIISPPSSCPQRAEDGGATKVGGGGNKKRKINYYSGEEARSFAFACSRKIKQLQQQQRHVGVSVGCSRPVKRARNNE